ncbi:MAG: DUF2953 domain-containing protein [Lachnospiraceae bacterium]|jgi:hypothetical protein|nr:DUF2953 domain-containing protein [Lachnospiraceae bacterium]
MAVVFLILKILGWALAGVVGLLLLAILLLVVVPVRYRINAQGGKDDPPQGLLRVTWLLHIVSFRLEYGPIAVSGKESGPGGAVHGPRIDGRRSTERGQVSRAMPDGQEEEKLRFVLRIFGFPLFRSDAGERQGKAGGKGESGSERETGSEGKADGEGKACGEGETDIEGKAGGERETGSEGKASGERETGSEGEAGGERETIKKRKAASDAQTEASSDKDTLYSIEETGTKKPEEAVETSTKKPGNAADTGIRASFHKIQARLDTVRDAFLSPENRKVIAWLWSVTKRLLRHIAPRGGGGEVVFGFDDPYTTGQAAAVCGALFGFIPRKMKIVPLFDREAMHGDVNLRGRLYAGYTLWWAFKVYRDKEVRRFIKQVRALAG